jgi:hypothetical protein
VICLWNLFIKHIPMMAGVTFDPVPEHLPDNPPFSALQFTSDEVESVLQDLDLNGGSGPNGIPLIILKNSASAFAKPLSLLFNRSMKILNFEYGQIRNFLSFLEIS